ncbi:hypothetical protein T310_9242, partial [Rasamsonia emersonii CBS 393.64]
DPYPWRRATSAAKSTRGAHHTRRRPANWSAPLGHTGVNATFPGQRVNGERGIGQSAGSGDTDHSQNGQIMTKDIKNMLDWLNRSWRHHLWNRKHSSQECLKPCASIDPGLA